MADKIRFIIGDALQEAPKLGITFDLAFMDGDKRSYRECYEMVMGILRPGGFILADNTLWDGHGGLYLEPSRQGKKRILR